MKEKTPVESQLEQLEELDVIEARELTIGNAFHAFRFRRGIEDIDADTKALVEKAAEALGVSSKEFEDLLDNAATENNPYSNFAQGVLEALKRVQAKK